MLNFIKKVDIHKEENTAASKKEDLIKEIRNVCEEMDKTNMWFQMEKNSDLIDACIHQREMLLARYKYLINKIKFDKIS